ncbi:MAG: DNA ligase-associated DEXH box helicase, partial [Flavobacteriaceae bacterium]|nr:DNA ligase-associated DEXH box helicase [Flavobacteriaceae bacterium]
MKIIKQWFESQNWKVQVFQKQCWKAYAQGKSGMLHAPTGSGKTYALWGGIVEEMSKHKTPPKGCHALWITPLRALGVEIQKATQKMLSDFNPELKVGLRTADTPQSQRNKLL